MKDFNAEYVTANWATVFLASYRVFPLSEGVEIDFEIEDEDGTTGWFTIDEFTEDSAPYVDMIQIVDANTLVTDKVLTD